MGVIHDLTDRLAKALKDCPECKSFREARRKLQADAAATKRLTELRAKQWELTALQMQGRSVPADQVKALEKAAKEVQSLPTVSAYLSAEQQLGQLWADVQRKLGTALGLDSGGGAKR